MTVVFERAPAGGWPRAEWLAARRSRIGASDVAAIVNWSRYASPMSLWLEKTGALEPDDEANEAAELGLFFEDRVLDLYERKTGLVVIERQSLVYDDVRPWLCCTLDGVAYKTVELSLPPDICPRCRDDIYWCRCEHPERDEPAESATCLVDAKMSLEWEWETIPLEYYAQGQTLMGVTGVDRIEFAVLHRGVRFKVYPLAFNPEAWVRIVNLAERFWGWVAAGTPPPVDAHEATTQALKDAYRDRADEGTFVELDDAWVQVACRWLDAKAAAKDAVRRKDWLENELRALLGTATEGRVDGLPFVTWNPEGRSRTLRPTKWLREHAEEIAS